MHQIKTALTSYGLSGSVFLAPFLVVNPGFKITKVLERSKENSKAKLPDAEIVRRYDEILEDKELELVIVNTPNELHYKMAKQALLKNKHVLVEKPFTIEVDEANEIIQLAKERGLKLTTCHNRRLDSGFLTIKKIIGEGLLGKIKVFDSQILRWKPKIGNKAWKTDGRKGAGLLYDLGSHLIDQALFLFGMPRAVFADIRTLRKNAIANDYFELLLYYEDLKVCLKSSLFANVPGHRFMIQGEKGNLTKNGNDRQEECLMKGEVPLGEDWGKEDDINRALITTENDNCLYPSLSGNYMIFFNNLYDAISKNVPLLVNPEEARDVIKIIKIAMQSHAERRVIDII